MPIPCLIAEGALRSSGRVSCGPPSAEDAMLAQIPKLRAFAYSLCGHSELADDLVQETPLRAWHHLDCFQEGTNLRAWLFTILRNAYYSELRKKKREVDDPDGKKAAMLSVAPNQQDHVDLRDLQTALGLLAAAQREAIVLVAAAGLSCSEAAKIARCPVGTIKSRISRARATLARMLGMTDQDAFGPDRLTAAIVGRGTGTQRRAPKGGSEMVL
jgi:RNA polymerase sigma-70 factor, ECF subfamily